MHRMAWILLFCLATASADAVQLDLEKAVGDVDWVGQPVRSPYWSADGQHIYYRLKRDGSAELDLYRVNRTDGHGGKVDPDATEVEGPPLISRDHRHAAFFLGGRLFVKDVATGKRAQVPQASPSEDRLQFSADGRALQYRQGHDWHQYDIATAISRPIVALKFGERSSDSVSNTPSDRQRQLFKAFREHPAGQQARHQDEPASGNNAPTHVPAEFWLDEDRVVLDSSLSPNGRWLILVTAPKQPPPVHAPQVMHYVTQSGYPEPERVRPYVGRDAAAPQSLLLVDLLERRSGSISVRTLPGIRDDPLKEIRGRTTAALETAGRIDLAERLVAPTLRPVVIDTRQSYGGGVGIVWSEDGKNAAIQLRAVDDKDRWIATVNFAERTLESQHRLSDHAWINWRFNDFGWHKDGRTLWYLSEESGYTQLYRKPLDGRAQALTTGSFEVSRPQLSPDGRWFYLRSNQVAPYSYDTYRLPANGGALVRLSHYQGLDDFILSPDGSQLALLHSAPYKVPQLAVQATAGGEPRVLTHTISPMSAAQDWIEPEIVQILSSHGAGDIHAKFYGQGSPAQSTRPAVIFLHGGDIQNVLLSYPPYFREQMFHNLLVRQGYVVLDVDYRITAGYGRQWRTAAYRDVGRPGLEDLIDAKQWLVSHRAVDPGRVGVYGGSMGGFMTLTALLRAPGEFAAGAALRPVTDWTTYNQGVSGALLNDPELDPEAYRMSSPIGYADQLRDPLLISHGLIDDNTLASDSIRLYQRFVELRKKDFWLSLYPMERHGFIQADAWYDQYRRIEELFNTHVKGR